jgi:hypothetical protein
MQRAKTTRITTAGSRIAVFVTFVALAAAAQVSSFSSSPSDPAEIVRKVVQNEVNSSNQSMHFQFRGTKTTPKGSVTKVYVETKDGTAGMAVAYDGKPLTDEQRRAEHARIERFLHNPEELRKKRKEEHEDDERTNRIVRALPDAFLFEYAGQETGGSGIGFAGRPLLKLKFRPNPSYHPPSRVEEVLTGMQGELLLDQTDKRMASIDATLVREVGFGWGILGHLDRGGRFVVHQQAMRDDIWEISLMQLKFNGKILLVKNLSIESTEVFDDFQRVPENLTFAQAVEMLEKNESGGAQKEARSTGH